MCVVMQSREMQGSHACHGFTIPVSATVHDINPTTIVRAEVRFHVVLKGTWDLF